MRISFFITERLVLTFHSDQVVLRGVSGMGGGDIYDLEARFGSQSRGETLLCKVKYYKFKKI